MGGELKPQGANAIPKATVATSRGSERALLVGLAPDRNEGLWSLEESLEELGQLAATAQAQVVGTVSQRGVRTAGHYVGKGKLAEIKEKVAELRCDLVILDDELSPTQQRNLENELQVKVIDRTVLILDVFARHASTRDGIVQVKLAQQEYLLPRLAGQWSHLERLGGGIGTRGPGETQIESDRRLARISIQRLKGQLEEIRQRRAMSRDRRKVTGVPVVSIVGYTNVGKSTLFNALSKAAVPVQNQLFSTLDPVTRRVLLPDGRHALLTDTVGFIQKLPPRLATAFRATLEELQAADLILHVVDITHRHADQQTQEVERILEEMGLGDRPRLLVLNKVDLLVVSETPSTAGEEPEGLSSKSLNQQLGIQSDPKTVLVSAAKRWGLQELLERIAQVAASWGGAEPRWQGSPARPRRRVALE